MLDCFHSPFNSPYACALSNFSRKNGSPSRWAAPSIVAASAVWPTLGTLNDEGSIACEKNMKKHRWDGQIWSLSILHTESVSLYIEQAGQGARSHDEVEQTYADETGSDENSCCYTLTTEKTMYARNIPPWRSDIARPMVGYYLLLDQVLDESQRIPSVLGTLAGSPKGIAVIYR